VIARGDLVWVDHGEPRGSAPAKARPSIVIQQDWLSESSINTVVVVPVTTRTKHAGFPGNVLLHATATGLDEDSVALVTQITAVSREHVDPYPCGHVPAYLMKQVDAGIRLTMGL
jgi:mRNA interferase MazF